MKKHIFSAIFITGMIFLGAGCNKAQQQAQDQNKNVPATEATSSEAGDRMAQETALANPASVYCLEKGGKLNLQKTFDGSTEGICILDDNTTCEEWALFRGECGPKNATSSAALLNQNSTSTKLNASSTQEAVEEQTNNAIVPENRLELEVEDGEEQGELITKWRTNGLKADDGFIIMLSGNENIVYPTKYMQVVKNPKSKSFTWTNLVSGRKYYFLICIAQGDKCGESYSQVISGIAK